MKDVLGWVNSNFTAEETISENHDHLRPILALNEMTAKTHSSDSCQTVRSDELLGMNSVLTSGTGEKSRHHQANANMEDGYFARSRKNDEKVIMYTEIPRSIFDRPYL